jgi:hypothetical protein
MLSRRYCLALGLCLIFSYAGSAFAQVSKGNWILLTRGQQVQGMVTKDDVFHLSTYSNANYTSIHWLWDSNPALHGPAPGYPWSRWVIDETKVPPQGSEGPYLSQLVTLQLGDEWNLNDPALRDRAVNWFNAIRASFPNTILYMNNYGGQVGDAQLYDFYSRAQPDMLCFDAYPWRSVYMGVGNPPGPPIPGPPTSWYGDLRRYREHAKGANLPLAIYRQTFHTIQDYDSTVYRDPSPSELRLNTFAALVFNARTLIDFTYNTGASSLFTAPGGDSNPNALYTEMAEANLRARNLGRALGRLTPVYDLHNPNTPSPPPGPASDDPNFPNGYTTSIMFLRGKILSGGMTNFTAVPNSFLNDPSTQNPANPTGIGYTWWEADKNDPYLRGWPVTNQAALKNDGLVGDVILAWFRPLDESFDGPTYSNQVYMMVVNGLTDPTGSAADCLQEIKLNFLNVAATTSLIMLDPASGQLQTNVLPVVNTRRQLVLNLNGGDAALFKFNTGAPFVGVTPLPAGLSVQIQAGNPAISIRGALGARYQLEAASSLPATNWLVLTNLLLPSSPYVFLDETSSSHRDRFYRALAVQ